ncbi:hypothetical protein [Halapricum hydrolyticum]|uniref:DUF8147 domain-containing protein n=1 Tax=Halapricum hydrolyticum TaxID=2979991 RepID=A0AAE3LFH8_9EURY|nr:hypothetical protein [Halapricum hydrolyticum]MCU4718511.1 hypothetical protein [Halapricum hydrolyticum]MCU4727470.1 hypothetical protein [Halapricum hydrolyticum]
MGYTDAVLATAAGIAAFALVFAAAVPIVGAALPNPEQVSMPIALGFGMAAMTGTYMGLAGRAGSREYRIAFASGAFGTTFLGVFLVGYAASGDLQLALSASAVAGALAGAGVLVVTR